MGLNQEFMVLFGNSIWFALLFIPSLFYNPNYRKTVAIVHSITTGFAILGVLILTIMAAVLGDEIVDAIAYWMESSDSSIYNNDGGWRRMQSSDWEDWEDWEDWGESGDWESSITALIWMAVITMWILVALRLFLSIVMCKFYK